MRLITFFWFIGATALITVVFLIFSFLAGPTLLLSVWNTVGGPLVRRLAHQAILTPDPDILILPLTEIPAEPSLQPVWEKLRRAPDEKVESAAQFRFVSTGVVVATEHGRKACYLKLATRPLVLNGPSGWGARILMFLLIALAVSYAFARQITLPVEQMRATARQFASGDLRARVGGQSFQAPELRELATDFDDMASRIESLVLSQKRLLSDVSHELRSPLARLSLAVGLARRNAAPETNAALDRVESEADHLNRLIGRVLQLARLEAGVEAPQEPVELRLLVEQIVNNANFEAENDKRVRLTVDQSYTLLGDPELLSSAIENVVRNALHYTAPATSVDVRLTRHGVTVRDHGRGVPPEKLRAIFEPFYRLSAGREARSGGVGLGLAIARRAVELHKGEIVARNVEGGGLEVEIRLPLST